MKLRTCQHIALQKCKQNKIGIVRMCCGSGKTLVEIILCLQEKYSCLVAPRNTLLKQHIEEFKKYLDYKDKSDVFEYSFETPGFQLITINCESDYTQFNKNTNKKVCFIINNSSFSKLPIVPDILVIDEAHTHKESIKLAKFKKVKRRYFFTATPQDMDDGDFYGETIYQFDYIHALERNYVCQFKIVPIWDIDNFQGELQDKLNKRKLTHTIHFYETVNGSNSKNLKMNEINTKKLIKCQKITAKTENREEILNSFKNDGGHLLSCKTVSYGIDIPECDSVFLSYIGNSIPDLVQKIMRSIRLYKLNTNKIAYIFVLMNTKELKEGDITDDIKQMKQQLIFKISSMLSVGIDVDILDNYDPYKQNIKEHLEEEIVELQNIISESGDISELINENKNIIDKINLEQNSNNKIEKSLFKNFFDDYELKVWYENGEIKSEISYNDKRWDENFIKLKDYVKMYNKLPLHSSKTIDEKSLSSWCSKQRVNYKKDILSDERITQLNTILIWYWEIDLDKIWDDHLIELKEFVKMYNKIPSRLCNSENKLLGKWCSNQRINYKSKILNNERITQLNTISIWKWDVLDETWDDKLIKLKEFVKMYNKIPSNKSIVIEEKLLNNWCSTQRVNYKKDILNDERITQLNNISIWYWDLDKIWDENLDKLKEFVKSNNKLPSETSKIREDKLLGSWCNNQRVNYKKDILSDERIIQLNNILIWYWDIDLDKIWDEKFIKLKEFVKMYDKLPSSKSIISEEKSLGNWCSTQRTNYKNKMLNDERITQLNSILIWYWEIDLDKIWDENLIKLKDYVKMYNKLPSQSSKIREDKLLGSWCNVQRVNYKRKTLSDERIAQLNSILIWKWDVLDEIWDENLNKLKDYVNIHNKLPSSSSKNSEENLLGKWCSTQRTNNKSKVLSNEKIIQLNSILIWYWEID